MMDLAVLNIEYPDVPDGMKPLAIKVNCNTPGNQTRANVTACMKRGLPVIDEQPSHLYEAILVGGGPSLASTMESVDYCQANGAHVFALNGAGKYLSEHGITPDYHVILDPRPSNVQFIGNAGKFLVASQCAPEMFDALEGKDVGVFHMAGSCLDMPEIRGCLIGGNITVGLSAMCLAYTMGYRVLRLFGYDSSFADTQHAYPQGLSNQEAKQIEVAVRDENDELVHFKTNFAMAKQAELFPGIAKMLAEADAVMTVHGEGLLPTIARAMMAPRLRNDAISFTINP